MSLRGTKCRGNPASGLLHSLRSFAMTLVLAWRLCLCCRLMHDAGLTSRVSDAGCHCEARSAAAIQTLPGEGLDERDEGDNEPTQDEHGDDREHDENPLRVFRGPDDRRGLIPVKLLEQIERRYRGESEVVEPARDGDDIGNGVDRGNVVKHREHHHHDGERLLEQGRIHHLFPLPFSAPARRNLRRFHIFRVVISVFTLIINHIHSFHIKQNDIFVFSAYEKLQNGNDKICRLLCTGEYKNYIARQLKIKKKEAKRAAKYAIPAAH